MRIFLILIAVLLSSFPALARSEKGDFLNPKLPVERRVADLMSRMTLDEKIGQLICPLGWVMYDIKSPDRVEVADTLKKLLSERNAGMLWAVYRADPWTRKTLDNGLNPRLAAMAGNAIQKYAIEHTRLGIPMFLAEEAPHGHMAIGTTVFPTGIGMAATWNPDLIRKVGSDIASEVRSQGAHISYGPVLDLSRDPRWSRVEETMGEDPALCAAIGSAMVRGLNPGNISDPGATIATLKHFLAYAVPEGGQNGNFSTVGRRDLFQNFLPPFRAAVDAGALSIMTSYNSIDGEPCTSNSELLTDVLHNRWGFRGFTVSDLYSIDGLHDTHHTAESPAHGAALALKAGVDVDLGGEAYMKLKEAFEKGLIGMTDIDRAVERVLRKKFEMGLFENPYVDPEIAETVVNSPEHRETAYQVALQSVTLLKNENKILPLGDSEKTVVLLGPNADNVYNMLGDYTAPQPDGKVTTVLQAFKSKLPAGKLIYVKGCAVRDTTTSDIASAVEAAQKGDIVVAVVGGSSARDFKTSYKATGAAVVDDKVLSDMESGEGYDRSTLSLMGDQQKLLEAVKATGKPLIVVYIEGRPLEKGWAAENADALLTAYYPGQEGGRAIADVIFGDYNPAGRLPFTVPRSVGQLPVYYNKRLPVNHDYVELSATPQYPFGYGLSYTKFCYSDMAVEYDNDANPLAVRFKLANCGERDGEEVAQLYVRDCYSSVVQPIKQLKGFRRVALKTGETKTVRIPLTRNDLRIIDKHYQEVIEPGDIEIMVGASSDDIRLREVIYVK